MKEENESEKRPYTSPQITVHGDIEVITLGSAQGNFTDAAFPINTPFRSLTFS